MKKASAKFADLGVVHLVIFMIEMLLHDPLVARHEAAIRFKCCNNVSCLNGFVCQRCSLFGESDVDDDVIDACHVDVQSPRRVLLGFPRFEPVLHDAVELISIGCMEHECDGLLRERLDFSLFFKEHSHQEKSWLISNEVPGMCDAGQCVIEVD